MWLDWDCDWCRTNALIVSKTSVIHITPAVSNIRHILPSFVIMNPWVVGVNDSFFSSWSRWSCSTQRLEKSVGATGLFFHHATATHTRGGGWTFSGKIPEGPESNQSSVGRRDLARDLSVGLPGWSLANSTTTARNERLGQRTSFEDAAGGCKVVWVSWICFWISDLNPYFFTLRYGESCILAYKPLITIMHATWMRSNCLAKIPF